MSRRRASNGPPGSVGVPLAPSSRPPVRRRGVLPWRRRRPLGASGEVVSCAGGKLLRALSIPNTFTPRARSSFPSEQEDTLEIGAQLPAAERVVEGHERPPERPILSVTHNRLDGGRRRGRAAQLSHFTRRALWDTTGAGGSVWLASCVVQRGCCVCGSTAMVQRAMASEEMSIFFIFCF